ncbi:MAG: DnaJ C-terminal domain-containing protein [Woeseiaceae bacterium]|nr:DnaJ C-terminal domain-containing protein [Woeseiaceae bacterium]
MMATKDYYDILGVARDASADEIKRAYRRLARKYHPDVSKESDAEARFKEMKEAYDVLRDPEKRAAYDRYGEQWRAGAEYQPPPEWGQDFSFHGSGFGGAGGFSDLFDSIFSDARAGAEPFGARFRDRRMDGADVSARITIPLEDAYRGTTRQIAVDLPESGRQGRRRTFNVRIPPGVTAGQRIRLADQGGRGTGQGAVPGDLFLEIDIAPHKTFKVDGRNVLLTLPVTPAEAATGKTVKVPTLGGTVDLKIPPASSSGRRLRLKGRGLPGSPPGDQIVELQIVLPKQLSAKARKLYEALAAEHAGFDPRRTLFR